MKYIEPKIRFGIMCDQTMFNAWQAQCIHNLLTLVHNIEVSLLVINDGSNLQKQNIFHKIKNIRTGKLLFQFYTKFFFKPRATSKVSLDKFLSNVPKLHCKITNKEECSQYFSESDIKIIRELNLDFILCFDFGIVRGEILNVPRYGVWSFRHDDEEKYRGSLSCFWEIYKGDPVTGAVLKRNTEKLDEGIILKKGFFKTIDYSYTKNLDQVYFESTIWPAEVCRDIRNNTADYLNAPPSASKAPIFHSPSNLQTLFFLIKTLFNLPKKKFSGFLRHEDWNIGIVDKPIHAFLTPDTKLRISWFSKERKNIFLADPFAITRNEKNYLFFEELDYRTNKQNISCMEIAGQNFFSDTKLVPDILNDASYPYLFEYRDKIYCIPESWRKREISLFEAMDFPSRWVKVHTLVTDITAIDSTVFQYEGRWWLTCTLKEEGEHLKLFLWYASGLFESWTPHVSNPVKTDIRSCRPAGTPFVHNGNLYRPSQDCSRTYGRRIVINRVKRLTPAAFEEEQAAVIDPDANYPYTDGIHTISALGNITIIDGKRYVFIPSAAKHALAKKFIRLRAFWKS